VDCLVDIQAELFLGLDSRGKGLFPSLHLFGRLFGTKFVVDDLQCSGFLHRTIRRGAVRTIYGLTCGSIDGFKERLALNIFEIRAAEPSKVHSPFWLFQQYTSTCLKEVREGVIVEGENATLHMH